MKAMFRGWFWRARYWAVEFFANEHPPETPGVEYALAENRCESVLAENRCAFVLPKDQ
jgi:hypothetical protein